MGLMHERNYQMSEQDTIEIESQVLETTSSPAPKESKNDKAEPSLRAKVVVFDNWCKGCGLCVAFCPREVLEMSDDGTVDVVAPERCILCHWCDTHCPDFAILVEPLDEDPNRRRSS
jgi:2-oxoglutarate ferredoxin oxidoreductase subunit delta